MNFLEGDEGEEGVDNERLLVDREDCTDAEARNLDIIVLAEVTDELEEADEKQEIHEERTKNIRNYACKNVCRPKGIGQVCIAS